MALAPIERLPTELIQPIFLYSGPNLSLALASHHIAAKLSDEYIYHATCTQYLTGPLTSRGEDDDQLYSREEQSRSQTAIFAAKWMTWSFFKAWCTKQYGPDSNGCLCNKTPEEGCFDPIWPPEWEDATKMVFSRSHLPNLAYVKARIPKKLLRNWDQDKIQFLRFLLWTSSMTVDWTDEETRNVFHEGKKEAFLTGNLEAVELFNHNRRLGKTPSLDLVRFAVVEGGCVRSIVYDTMLTARMWGVKAEGWNDEVLNKWCEDRIQEGNPKAEWLKTKLAELRKTKEDEENDKGKAPATATEGDQPVAPGTLDPKSADYDDVDGDKLVVKQHRWNQEVVLIGWVTQRSPRYFYPRNGPDAPGSRHEAPKSWFSSFHLVHAFRERIYLWMLHIPISGRRSGEKEVILWFDGRGFYEHPYSK